MKTLIFAVLLLIGGCLHSANAQVCTAWTQDLQDNLSTSCPVYLNGPTTLNGKPISGTTVPLLNGANTWSGAQSITSATPSTSPCTGALVVGTSPNCVGIGGGTLNATAANFVGPTFNVMTSQYGAKGDGVVDDGLAIRSAVADACNASANSGYGGAGTVVFPEPSVAYLVKTKNMSGLGGIVVGDGLTHCTVKLLGIVGNTAGDYRGGVNVKLDAGLNVPLLYQRRETSTIISENIRWDGNRAGQTGCVGCPGGGLATVASEDSSYTLTTNNSSAASTLTLFFANPNLSVDPGQSVTGTNITGACVVSSVTSSTVVMSSAGSCAIGGAGVANGATITFAVTPTVEGAIAFEGSGAIVGGYNYGYYLGSGRGSGWISPNTLIRFNGQTTSDYAVYLNGFDYEIFAPQIGNNTGAGILCNEGNQYHIFGGAIFLNNVGIVANSACTDFHVSQTHIDSNTADGIQLNGGSATTTRTFSHVLINPPASGASATYADALLTNDVGSVFIAPTFGNNNGGTPKYNIDFSGTSNAQVIASTIVTVGTSGFTNTAADLVAHTPGDLVAGGGLLAVGNVKAAATQAATQYSGSGGSAIPSCVAGLAGTFATVSDGKASPTLGGAYTAGDGSTMQPVWCNGSGWQYL